MRPDLNRRAVVLHYPRALVWLRPGKGLAGSSEVELETRITEAQLAENVGDIVDRVRRGEQFVIFREGEAVAVLGPTHPKLSTTMQEVAERLRSMVSPEDRLARDTDGAVS